MAKDGMEKDIIKMEILFFKLIMEREKEKSIMIMVH